MNNSKYTVSYTESHLFVEPYFITGGLHSCNGYVRRKMIFMDEQKALDCAKRLQSDSKYSHITIHQDSDITWKLQ